MANVVKKLSWTGTNGDTLLQKVQELQSTGYTIESACRKISKESVTLFGMPLTGEQLSCNFHRIRRVRRDADSTLRSAPIPQSGLTVTLSELRVMAQLMSRYAITII